jgi:hypothetical protein
MNIKLVDKKDCVETPDKDIHIVIKGIDKFPEVINRIKANIELELDILRNRIEYDEP